MKLVKEQDPGKFSRDPYLQLERYFKKIGDDAEAADIHYKSHLDFRQKANDPNGRPAWTWKRNVGDWLLFRGIGYGHKAWLLLLPILIIILTGALVFWHDNALVLSPDKAAKSAPVPADGSTAQSTAVPDDGSTAKSMPVPADSSNFWQKALERSAYSLDLLVPVLDLRYGTMWIPNPSESQPWRGLREFYAIAHSVIGWALIAVILAWLAGIIKTE